MRYFRRGDYNLIVCNDEVGYHTRYAGFLACKYLADNGCLAQREKAARVGIHKYIRAAVTGDYSELR